MTEKSPKQPSETPLHIQARDSVSCPSPGHIWFARGDVVLKKGDLTITADGIDIEFERDPVVQALKSPTHSKPKVALLVPLLSRRVKSISAKGHVVVRHPSGTLHSAAATYTFAAESMHASGSDIRLTTPQWRLNCKKSLTYSHATGHASAVGKARLIRGGQGLESEALQARFGPTNTPSPCEKPGQPIIIPAKQASQDLLWARSACPIRLWNSDKKYVTTAHSALFNAVDQSIHLKGQVRIRHKTEYITGHSAIMDLRQHTIRIFNNVGTGNSLNNRKSLAPQGHGHLEDVCALIPTTSFSSHKKAP